MRELHAHPNARALIVRKTRASLSETGLVTLEEKILGSDHPLVMNGPQRQHRFKYTLPNGSELVTGGMDRSTRIMSAEYDLIFVQEATELNLDEWEALTTRLRNGRVPYQQQIADCNPGPSTHWLKKRADEGRATMLHSRHEDNPVLFSEDGTLTPEGERYLARLDRLTGVRRERLRYGRWVSAEGVVYDEFDPTTHILDRHDLPPFTRRYRAVDFGFTNPFVCQWWGEDHDGRLYLYREHYRTRQLVEDHASTINEHSSGETYASPPICDHDAEDRATLERHLDGETRTLSAYKAVSTGIEAVKARLRIQDDGKPRLYFVRDALLHADEDLLEAGHPTSTLQEIEQYAWAKDAAGRPNKETPTKEFDHGMDTLRYTVAHVDKLKSTPSRPKRPTRRYPYATR